MSAPFARQIGSRATELMAALAVELGVTVQYKGGTLGSTSAILKFEFAIVNAEGVAETESAVNFKRFATNFGLAPEDLGREFTSRGTAYKIEGLNLGAPRFPISGARVSDGRAFKFPTATVVAGLKRA